MAGAILGRPHRVLIEAVQAYLGKTGSKSQDTSKSNKQIVDEIKKEVAAGRLKIDLADGTIPNHLSYAANRDIVSGSPTKDYESPVQSGLKKGAALVNLAADSK